MAVLVEDIMTRDVVTAPPGASILVAMDLMLKNNVSGVPVVDEHDRLLGLITEYDVLELYWDHEKAAASSACEDYMRHDVKSVQRSATVEVAARLFHAASLRRLLVLDGDKLVGILSRRDVLRCLCERLAIA